MFYNVVNGCKWCKNEKFLFWVEIIEKCESNWGELDFYNYWKKKKRELIVVFCFILKMVLKRYIKVKFSKLFKLEEFMKEVYKRLCEILLWVFVLIIGKWFCVLG